MAIVIRLPFLSFGNRGRRLHDPNSYDRSEITPHVAALFYYSSLGLLDPKAGADAKALQAVRGGTFRRNLALAAGIGLVTWGIGGYLFDPFDKRPGWDMDMPPWDEPIREYSSDFLLPGNQNIWF
jgi:hypothetical protein